MSVNNQMDLDNPFQRSKRIGRSPIRHRSKSINDSLNLNETPTPGVSTQNFNNKIPNAPNTNVYGEDINLNLELQKAFALIDQLSKENTELKNELEKIKHANGSFSNSAKTSAKIQELRWEEEEELVNKETAWLLPKSKKRKANFSPLKETERTVTEKKTQKPPPVIISNLTNDINATGMLAELKIQNINFNATMLNNNQMKVNATTPDDYRTMVKTIKKTELEWHTYESKQTRPIRVVLRGLHVSCDVESIKVELKNKGYKIIEVQQRLKKTKDGLLKLPLFTLIFECDEDVKKIYEISNLCYMKVKVEALRTTNLIPQCKNCQRYGHTKSFCKRKTICVKCAGMHDSRNCPKPANDPPKCSNCAESHPANYRGCVIAKELQKRRELLNRPIKQNERRFVSKRVAEGVSYAQKTKEQNDVNQPAKESVNQQTDLTLMMQNMLQMMNSINERLDRVEARQMGAVPKSTS